MSLFRWMVRPSMHIRSFWLPAASTSGERKKSQDKNTEAMTVLNDTCVFDIRVILGHCSTIIVYLNDLIITQSTRHTTITRCRPQKLMKVNYFIMIFLIISYISELCCLGASGRVTKLRWRSRTLTWLPSRSFLSIFILAGSVLAQKRLVPERVWVLVCWNMVV